MTRALAGSHGCRLPKLRLFWTSPKTIPMNQDLHDLQPHGSITREPHLDEKLFMCLLRLVAAAVLLLQTVLREPSYALGLKLQDYGYQCADSFERLLKSQAMLHLFSKGL